MDSSLDFARFRDFQKRGFLTDFVIISKDNVRFQAHKLVLSSRSLYFETLFSNGLFIENLENSVHLPYDSEVSGSLIVILIQLNVSVSLLRQ